MKILLILIFGLSISMMSFQKQDNAGRILFERSCNSCHLPNKATQYAPSFQNIRKDYGLKWTLNFIKDSRKLREQGDIKALYGYYQFGKLRHTDFPILQPKYVIKVLDYVDSFPVDTSGFRHRMVSYSEMENYVLIQKANDTTLEWESSIYSDTLFHSTENSLDTSSPRIRRSYRRTAPKSKD